MVISPKSALNVNLFQYTYRLSGIQIPIMHKSVVRHSFLCNGNSYDSKTGQFLSVNGFLSVAQNESNSSIEFYFDRKIHLHLSLGSDGLIGNEYGINNSQSINAIVQEQKLLAPPIFVSR